LVFEVVVSSLWGMSSSDEDVNTVGDAAFDLTSIVQKILWVLAEPLDLRLRKGQLAVADVVNHSFSVGSDDDGFSAADSAATSDPIGAISGEIA